MIPRYTYLTIILSILSMAFCHAQQFRVTNLSEENGQVTISFRIDKIYPKERYSVQVFSSHDNYQSPLQYVTGDVGGAVESSSETYRVVWDAQRELTTYDGQVQLELRGEVVYLPIHMQPQSPEIKAKHRKNTTISWRGGDGGDQVKIDLLKNGVLVKELARTNNSGNFVWTVDRSVGKGQGFQLRFVNLDNEGESYETRPFRIAGRTSPAVWILPLLAGGGAAAFVVVSGGDGGNGNNDLPDPPLPSGNN